MEKEPPQPPHNTFDNDEKIKQLQELIELLKSRQNRNASQQNLDKIRKIEEELDTPRGNNSSKYFHIFLVVGGLFILLLVGILTYKKKQ